jgi:hypothetical protein
MRERWWKRLDLDVVIMLFVLPVFAFVAEVIHMRSQGHLGWHEVAVGVLLIWITLFLGKFGMTLKGLDKSSEDVSAKVTVMGTTLKRLEESSKDISVKLTSIADSVAGGTLVLGLKSRSQQYQQGADVLSTACGPIFLMQRSSSLILGWEEGADEEKRFYDNLMLRIKETEFYPVVSLEGIKTHLDQHPKRFKHKEDAFGHLRKDDDDNIYVQSEEATRPHALKRFDSSDYKQGRILLVGRRERQAPYADAIIVFDVGTRQFSLHLRGPDLKECLEDCRDFYDKQCHPLTVDELLEEVPKLRDLPIQPLRAAIRSKDD